MSERASERVSGRGPRVAIFTTLPDLEATPWWTVVSEMPGIEAIVVVRQVRSRRLMDVIRRLRRNVRKHGPLFVPYRVAVMLASLFSRPVVPRRASTPDGPPPFAVGLVESENIHEPGILEYLSRWKPDIGISIGAPVLKRPLFSIPTSGTLNVHLGKVPDFRGAPPGFWELWHGANEIGATIHWVDDGLDTGPVVGSASAPIYEHDTLERVESRAAELGRALLADALREVAAGRGEGSLQVGAGRTNRAPTIGQRFALWRRRSLRRIRVRVRDPLGLAKLVVAGVWLCAWRPLRDAIRTALGRHPVRVFTFHRVTSLCRDGMTISPEMFMRQIDFVRRHHTMVSLDRAVELLAPGQRLRRPVAALTFDDGYGSVGSVAAPLMRDRGLTGTCFVCTDFIGTERRFDHDASSAVRDSMKVMDWSELSALREAGWQVGAHTASHVRLSVVSRTALHDELRAPLSILREWSGSPHVAMAYPFGGPDDITTDGVLEAKEAGYSALVSNVAGENLPGDDPFSVRRVDIGGDHDPIMWKAAALGLDLGRWKRRMGREETPARASTAAPLVPAARRPLRVTHIVFDLDGGGMETLVAGMAERWHDEGIALSVITLSGRVGRVGEAVRPLVEQFHVPRLTPGVSMLSPSAVVRALRATGADVVHLHTGAWLKGAYAAALAGAHRVIYTEHGREHHDPPLARFQDRMASRLTDHVVTVSDRLRSYMVHAVGVRPDLTVTIPNGVDTNVFSPGTVSDALRASLRIPDNALVLGSIGRLEPVKGYERLVAAYAQLREVDFGRPLVLVIFGEGTDRPAIEREVERLGVGDGVRMPGWTSRPADGYRLFDLFAMTSRSEGMSVSLMEAMACGVCPVVTDVGSNADVMGAALRNHLVADDDMERFVEVARELLLSERRRREAAERARAHAELCHSFDRMIGDYERLYRGEPVTSDADLRPAVALI